MGNSISGSKSKLREQVLRLEQGFPQDWIYIEREIRDPIESKNNEGVKASQNFVGKSISDIFREDTLNIYNQKVSRIRPIIGPNGSGKTTLLKFHIKDYLNEIAPSANLFLFFDFKSVTENINQFWPIFIQILLDQLISEEKNLITELINKLDPSKIRVDLIKIFKNNVLIDNLLKLTSLDPNERAIAFEHFYSEEFDSKAIGDLFYGILKLALQLDFIVVIAFDEIQFLKEIDVSNVLLKLFLEKFVRHLLELFSKEKLYILMSCLENPDLREWTNLKSGSKSFESIIRGKEIILGDLTIKEKDEIIQQVAERIGFDKESEKLFFSKIKGSILYYLPRDLLKTIAIIIDSMGYVSYTEYDIRQMYEEEARNYMRDILRQKGFVYLEPEIKKIGGYNVDIYATESTNRAGYIKKAFGETTMMKKSRMKQKVEKFSNWLLRMKGREYNPDKGDYAFFVCPNERITQSAKDVLDANKIELFSYISPIIEQIIQQGEKKVKIPKGEIAKTGVEIGEGGSIYIKDKKYKLNDVPGIGSKTLEKLNKAGIHSIQDLLNCNAKIKAKEIERVGEASINKWKQAARQILSG